MRLVWCEDNAGSEVLWIMRKRDRLTQIAPSAFGGTPVSIGVVGHRDLPEAECSRIVKLLTSILTTYRDEHPHTPIVVLTALAEGADRLAAEAALSVAGVSVLAVLPMPIEECRRDFDDPQSSARFDASLASAHVWISLRLQLRWLHYM